MDAADGREDVLRSDAYRQPARPEHEKRTRVSTCGDLEYTIIHFQRSHVGRYSKT